MTKPNVFDTVVVKCRDLKNDYYSLILEPIAKKFKCQPGQFAHMKMPKGDLYFRRAFSIASSDEKTGALEIIFKVFGRGTRILADVKKGDRLDILGPLGKAFKFPPKSATTIIVAGGVGFPPLMYLATAMVSKGYDPAKIKFFYGGKTSVDLIERAKIKKLGVDFQPVTEDGSIGTKGLITKAIENYLGEYNPKAPRIYACGPEGMLKATDELGIKNNIPGELSLEAPMPCGIGICLGCVVPLRAGGNARVCVDGPIFEIGEVIL